MTHETNPAVMYLRVKKCATIALSIYSGVIPVCTDGSIFSEKFRKEEK